MGNLIVMARLAGTDSQNRDHNLFGFPLSCCSRARWHLCVFLSLLLFFWADSGMAQDESRPDVSGLAPRLIELLEEYEVLVANAKIDEAREVLVKIEELGNAVGWSLTCVTQPLEQALPEVVAETTEDSSDVSMTPKEKGIGLVSRASREGDGADDEAGDDNRELFVIGSNVGGGVRIEGNESSEAVDPERFSGPGRKPTPGRFRGIPRVGGNPDSLTAKLAPTRDPIVTDEGASVGTEDKSSGSRGSGSGASGNQNGNSTSTYTNAGATTYVTDGRVSWSDVPPGTHTLDLYWHGKIVVSFQVEVRVTIDLVVGFTEEWWSLLPTKGNTTFIVKSGESGLSAADEAALGVKAADAKRYGDYLVFVDHSVEVDAVSSSRGDAAPPVVTRRRNPSLSIKVGTQEQEVPKGAMVTVKSTDGAVQLRRSATEAGVALDDLVPGRYTIITTAPGYTPTEREVELTAWGDNVAQAQTLLPKDVQFRVDLFWTNVKDLDLHLVGGAKRADFYTISTDTDDKKWKAKEGGKWQIIDIVKASNRDRREGIRRAPGEGLPPQGRYSVSLRPSSTVVDFDRNAATEITLEIALAGSETYSKTWTLSPGPPLSQQEVPALTFGVGPGGELTNVEFVEKPWGNRHMAKTGS